MVGPRPTFRLISATLRVADLPRVEAFYAGLLGLQARRINGHAVELAADAGAPGLIRLEEVPAAPPRPRDAAGLYHLALLVPARVQLAEVLVRLTQHHHSPQGLADHGVSEAVYLADPEGNGVEIYADRPPAAWPRAGDRVAMGTAPLDVEGLLRILPTDAPPPAPLRGATLGHVHLEVGSLDRARVFYGTELGMAVRQDDYPGALFLAADGYHHHFGLNVWRGVRRPVAPAARGLAGLTVARTGEPAPRVVTDPDGETIQIQPL
jgi:catechol 2,3-dioxygenase